MSQDANENDYHVHLQINTALNSLKINRPNDRTEKDRAYAVCITEIEKALAYFDVFVLGVIHQKIE